MRQILLIVIFQATLAFLDASAALPIFPTGEANLSLGDPLKRITNAFPDLKSMCGTDQTGTFIEAYQLENPSFVDAKEMWFILDRHIVTQVDYVFTRSQFADFERQGSVRERISQYFGSEGTREIPNRGYEDSLNSFSWHDYDTGEKALVDFLKNGDVRVSFLNPRLKRTDTQDAPERPAIDTPSRQQQPSVANFEPGEVGRMLQANRPPNGTIFVQTSRQGHGELTIQNGTKWDAQVKLVSPTRKYVFISVYVHSGESASVTNIRPNTYNLVYALGEGWDEARQRMFRISSTAAFDKPLTFERSSEYYSTYRVTLHPVEGGNVNSRPISQDDFLSY